MEKKSEVHALEYAVVEFLVELRLFLYHNTDAVKVALTELDLGRCGLKISTEKETDDSQDDMRIATVHSTGWNDDQFFEIHFKKDEMGWHVKSGAVEGFREFFRLFDWAGDEKIYFSCYLCPATHKFEKLSFQTLIGAERTYQVTKKV